NVGEIFTPPASPGGTGSWQTITAIPTPNNAFGDGQLQLLDDGTVLAGWLSGSTSFRYNPNLDPLLNPALPPGTQPWSSDAVMINSDSPNEEAWVKLPDGSILAYEIFGTQPQASQRFTTHPIASAVGTATTPITITTTNPLPVGLTTGANVTL